MSSLIPGVCALFGSYYIYRYASETKTNIVKMGSILILGGVLLSISAKTLLFHNYPNWWFAGWEVGHGTKCIGIALTLYPFYLQLKEPQNDRDAPKLDFT